MGLPTLFRLALANFGEVFQPLLDLQEDVQLDGGLLPFFKSGLDELFRLDWKFAAIEEALPSRTIAYSSRRSGELLRFST